MAKNKVKGLAECKRNIDTVVRNTIPKNAERAMYVTLTLIENRSLEYVPLDTANLLNSRFKIIEQEGAVTIGRIGFTASYALPLHSPKPGGKMDGWQPRPVPSPGKQVGGYNPSATQDWLNIGLNEAWPEIQSAVKEEMAL
jgi:hypothetical protein